MNYVFSSHCFSTLLNMKNCTVFGLRRDICGLPNRYTWAMGFRFLNGSPMGDPCKALSEINFFGLRIFLLNSEFLRNNCGIIVSEIKNKRGLMTKKIEEERS